MHHNSSIGACRKSRTATYIGKVGEHSGRENQPVSMAFPVRLCGASFSTGKWWPVCD